ncbi:MAG: cyclic lactone autoinducer peptide [Eubacterium sp.]|nr:cyclic lactone autoinducer peptide [Eubacterium sp.]
MESVSKLALNSANKACGAASWFDSYQPKEPKNLAEKLRKMSK